MRSKTSKAVIGLGFGDEGKGLTTSFLVSKTENPIVVRFSGGNQAGHTVVYNGKRHVFSNLGSGTLQDAPTYWSELCTFSPVGFLTEHNILDITPLFFINPLAPVVTPLDILHNRLQEAKNNHGSVGVGFGATIERQENNVKFYVQDLYCDKILELKLKMIEDYYGLPWPKEELDIFRNAVNEVRDLIHMSYDDIITHFTPIYEGSQGILLDKDFGFFPNVTRDNTTTKNLLKLGQFVDEVYYVTRSYQTRHGNGPMFNEGQELILTNNENETNVHNPIQGNFRVAPLDPEIVDYAIQCDDNFSSDATKNLVITCMDQHAIDVEKFLDKLTIEFEHVYLSHGPSLENISKYPLFY